MHHVTIDSRRKCRWWSRVGAVGRLHGSDEDIRLGPLGRRAGGLDRSPDRVRELLLEHEQVERETGRAGDGFEPTQRVVRAPRRRHILKQRRRRGGALARCLLYTSPSPRD